jgi:uncharacterized protein (DUF2249 family)
MENKSSGIPITPDTKVGALLDSYPQLESTLLEIAPAFAKLQSPILRKTVAKVTTLRQAAKVGGVSLADMINKLRQAAGITLGEIVDDAAAGAADDKRPEWFDESAICKSIDGRPILEKGEHPVGIVLKEIGNLQKGRILELITPFLPAPLIDKGKEVGCLAWSKSENADIVKTYFYKK